MSSLFIGGEQLQQKSNRCSTSSSAPSHQHQQLSSHHRLSKTSLKALTNNNTSSSSLVYSPLAMRMMMNATMVIMVATSYFSSFSSLYYPLLASAQIAGESVTGDAADTLSFLPANVSAMTCSEYNPCLSGMLCCDVPQWYKDEINARILLLRVVTNNTDAIAYGGTNISAPNQTISWLGTPPFNESVYCCFSTQVCSDTLFCELETEPSDIGGGSGMLAGVVIVGLIVSGLLVVGCYLLPTESHIEIISNKRRKRAEVLAQFDPHVASDKREVGWLDLH